MTLRIIELHDEQIGSRARILSDFGFNCFSFVAAFNEQRIETLWAANAFDTGHERPSGSGIPILFPFAGRITGTTFRFAGQPYVLPEGDGRGNAIHGFVLNRAWRVIEQTSRRAVGQFQASRDDEQILEYWPADFLITCTYELIGNALTTQFEIENPDDKPLPFGLGTHPYFRVPLGGSNADSCVVRVPARSKWELLNMLPTGTQTPLDDVTLASGMPFAQTAFDDVFTDLQSKSRSIRTTIADPESRRTMIMNFDESFHHCVVYNPPHRQALCIEPYTCVPDTFRLEEQGIATGLRLLQPGETATYKTTIVCS